MDLSTGLVRNDSKKEPVIAHPVITVSLTCRDFFALNVSCCCGTKTLRAALKRLTTPTQSRSSDGVANMLPRYRNEIFVSKPLSICKGYQQKRDIHVHYES